MASASLSRIIPASRSLFSQTEHFVHSFVTLLYEDKAQNTVLAAGGVLMAEGDGLMVQALKEKLGLQQLIGESQGRRSSTRS